MLGCSLNTARFIGRLYHVSTFAHESMMLKRNPNKLYPHDKVLAFLFVRFIPNWVKPNMLTVLRLALTPAVLILMSLHRWSWALPLFLFTAFTDALDGSLAR